MLEKEKEQTFFYMKVGFTVLNMGRCERGKKQMVLNEKIDS